MKHIFTTLLFFLAFNVLTAQNDANAIITGLVTDAFTDAPVELAVIYVEGTNNAVETNLSGRYRISIPSNEEVKLVFTRIGYKESIVTLSSKTIILFLVFHVFCSSIIFIFKSVVNHLCGNIR